jgi:hypothetical protein
MASGTMASATVRPLSRLVLMSWGFSPQVFDKDNAFSNNNICAVSQNVSG